MKEMPYFKHDSNARSDSRIIKIRQKFNAKGYGIYFMLIEMLRGSRNYEMKFDLEMLAFDIREDKETIEEIIKKFGLFSFRKDVFYSPSLKSRMKNLDKMREHWIKAANKRWVKPKQLTPAQEQLTPAQVKNIQ
jgi:hypothetical protein